MNFSDLNEHLFNKNCIDSSMCRCGKGPESADHYFLSCEIYELQRENIIIVLKVHFHSLRLSLQSNSYLGQ